MNDLVHKLILGFLINICFPTLIIFMSIPLYNGKVKMNKVFGVRFKKSFESEELWYKINRYGARQMIIWSIPQILLGITAFFVNFTENGKERTGLVLLFIMAPLMYLLAGLITYIYARQL